MGLLQEGDPADFIMVRDLEGFRTLATCIDGQKVAENGASLIESPATAIINNFKAGPCQPQDFVVPAASDTIRIIEAHDGQLVTGSATAPARIENGLAIGDPQRDILKIAVVNRYQDNAPAMGFIKNFGLKRGAIASSVTHDSHNIIAVGTSDAEICRAVNLIIQAGGGLAAVDNDDIQVLELPVAGLMADNDVQSVAQSYMRLDNFAKNLGTGLRAPFMTLAFMALPVIPALKLTDRGLFDGETFSYTKLFV